MLTDDDVKAGRDQLNRIVDIATKERLVLGTESAAKRIQELIDATVREKFELIRKHDRERKPDQPSLEALTRELYDANLKATFGGLSVPEIYELKAISDPEWSELAADWSGWRARVNGINLRNFILWLLLVLAAGGAYRYADVLASTAGGEAVWWKAGALVGLATAAVLFAFVGQYLFQGFIWQGYREGFASGVSAGVNRALGLSTADLAEIRKIHEELQLDAEVIRLFDKNPIRQ
jgi:hypothetical protein